MTPYRFGIVAARFNAEITGRLLDRCVRTLKASGVPATSIVTVRVPGSYEIPWAASELARSGRFDALICLGAILRGRTTQNDHIAASTFHHLHAVSIATRVPCILGIITPNTYGQALARTRGRLDRGREAALAALEMAELSRRLRPRRSRPAR